MEQGQEVVNEGTKTENTQEVANPETSNDDTGLDDVLERVKHLEQSRERLEAESKKWKSRYKELESTNEEAKRERLEQEGKYQELLEMEKNKNMQTSKKMQDLKKQALNKELRAQVANYAKDAFDIDDVVDAIGRIGSEVVSIDVENMSVGGIQEAVAMLRENKRHLFDSGKPASQVSSRPMGQTSKTKSVNEMNMAEKTALFKEVFKPPQPKN